MKYTVEDIGKIRLRMGVYLLPLREWNDLILFYKLTGKPVSKMIDWSDTTGVNAVEFTDRLVSDYEKSQF